MDETENLVLRLLREIRADLTAVRGKLDEHDHAFDRIDRRIDDMKETVALSLGFAVQANATYETAAERIDKLRREVEALRARVDGLEGAR